MSILKPEITAFLADIGQTTKATIKQLEQKLANISNFEIWGLILVVYK